MASEQRLTKRSRTSTPQAQPFKNDTPPTDDTTGPKKAKPVIGLVLNINGKAVTVDGSNLTNIKENGFELGITEPVVLGTFNDMKNYLITKFGVTIPAADDLPAPFKSIINTVLSLEVTIVKAHLKYPGTKSIDQHTQYTLVMTVLAKSVETIKLGSVEIGIMGAVLGVTNEGVVAADALPA